MISITLHSPKFSTLMPFTSEGVDLASLQLSDGSGYVSMIFEDIALAEKLAKVFEDHKAELERKAPTIAVVTGEGTQHLTRDEYAATELPEAGE